MDPRQHDALVADSATRGREFGQAFAAIIDDAIVDVLSTVGDRNVAVVAQGSYARRELCPGSDLDVLLLHDGRSDIAEVADTLWYPLWDAGLVLGHSTRTRKESLKLAETDLDTLTALLDARVVAGAAVGEADRLVAAGRELAMQRSGLALELRNAATLRRRRPGPVAEMSEPNLKDGAGGLRDVHSLVWGGWTLGGVGGLAALTGAGALVEGDEAFLDDATAHLLDIRVALHRVTGGRSDVLALQDHDAVADLLGFEDADALVHSLAAVAASRRLADPGRPESADRRHPSSSSSHAPPPTTARRRQGGQRRVRSSYGTAGWWCVTTQRPTPICCFGSPGRRPSSVCRSIAPHSWRCGRSMLPAGRRPSVTT